MDGNLFNAYRLKPDQIQVVNPLLIILFIPIFEYIIYPLLAKVNILKKPLQRMVTGGILAAVAFIICGFFQLKIEGELPTQLNDNSIHLAIFNGMPANIKIESSSFSSLNGLNIKQYDQHIEENVNINDLKDFNITVKVNENFGQCDTSQTYSANLDSMVSRESSLLFITQSICETTPTIHVFNYTNVLEKPAEGGAYAGVLFAIDELTMYNSTFLFKNEKLDETEKVILSSTQPTNYSVGYTQYAELDVHIGGDYSLTLKTESNVTEIKKDLKLDQGGSYILVINSIDVS